MSLSATLKLVLPTVQAIFPMFCFPWLYTLISVLLAMYRLDSEIHVWTGDNYQIHNGLV